MLSSLSKTWSSWRAVAQIRLYGCSLFCSYRHCAFSIWGGVMNMYVSSAALNKRSLGTVYGLSRVATSVLNIVAPGADWLFAFSLTHNVLGGKLAYVVLLGVVCVTLGVSAQLPKNTWARREDSEELGTG
ncbi:hypothetical protein EDB89DRAFT_2244809 [Lactarius sanguifluus]|nr:hypothetical protein EDB89DRAFT_2244809 [Lactarius sanguifluus]